MKDIREFWWAISHDGIICMYGHRSQRPLEHHNGHSTPVVNVRRDAVNPSCLMLETASGSRYCVASDPDRSTPGPEWRGLGTMLVQKQRKLALLAGEVFGIGVNMTLAERIAARRC